MCAKPFLAPGQTTIPVSPSKAQQAQSTMVGGSGTIDTTEGEPHYPGLYHKHYDVFKTQVSKVVHSLLNSVLIKLLYKLEQMG